MASLVLEIVSFHLSEPFLKVKRNMQFSKNKVVNFHFISTSKPSLYQLIHNNISFGILMHKMKKQFL